MYRHHIGQMFLVSLRPSSTDALRGATHMNRLYRLPKTEGRLAARAKITTAKIATAMCGIALATIEMTIIRKDTRITAIQSQKHTKHFNALLMQSPPSSAEGRFLRYENAKRPCFRRKKRRPPRPSDKWGTPAATASSR